MKDQSDRYSMSKHERKTSPFRCYCEEVDKLCDKDKEIAVITDLLEEVKSQIITG